LRSITCSFRPGRVLKPDDVEVRLQVEHRNDVLRIVQALAEEAIVVTEDVAFAAWRRFSEGDRCAVWYGLGSSSEIRERLLPYLELRRIDDA
jgi:hypothetical protein